MIRASGIWWTWRSSLIRVPVFAYKLMMLSSVSLVCCYSRSSQCRSIDSWLFSELGWNVSLLIISCPLFIQNVVLGLCLRTPWPKPKLYKCVRRKRCKRRSEISEYIKRAPRKPGIWPPLTPPCRELFIHTRRLLQHVNAPPTTAYSPNIRQLSGPFSS